MLESSGVVKSPCEARPGNAPMDGFARNTLRHLPAIRLPIVEKWLSDRNYSFGEISGTFSGSEGGRVDLKTGSWHRWSYSAEDRDDKLIEGSDLAGLVESLYNIPKEVFTTWLGLSIAGCDPKIPPEILHSEPWASRPPLCGDPIEVRAAVLTAWLPDSVRSPGSIDVELPDGGAVWISLATCHWIRRFSSFGDCDSEQIEGNDLTSFAEVIFGMPQEIVAEWIGRVLVGSDLESFVKSPLRSLTVNSNRLPVNFDRVNHAALVRALDILQRWLPGGRIEGSEYVACNPKRNDKHSGSFKINWKTGRWADWSNG